MIFAHGLTGWEGAVAKIGMMPDWGLGLMVAGGLWWAIWQQRWRWIGPGVVLAGLVAPFTEAPPDMIVGEKHVAFYAGQERYWLQGKQGFVPYIWFRETGSAGLFWPNAPAMGADGQRLACDPQACVYETSGGRIVTIADPAAASECLRADLGIARLPARGCLRWPRYGETLVVRLRNGNASVESSWGGNWPWN